MNDVASGERHEFSLRNDHKVTVVVNRCRLPAHHSTARHRNLDDSTEGEARGSIIAGKPRVAAAPLIKPRKEMPEDRNEERISVNRATLREQGGRLRGREFVGCECDIDADADDDGHLEIISQGKLVSVTAGDVIHATI